MYHRDLKTVFVFSLPMFVLFSDLTEALPRGATIKEGDIVISTPSNDALQVLQSSDKGIIDWAAFDIGADESVKFVQPTDTAVTLNRIEGTEASLVNGVLESNGNVFLINPHGLVFGRTASVNVGGLLASSSDISNNNFMTESFVFDQPGHSSAMITNEGNITVSEYGIASLVAPSVANSGVISAKLGTVNLVSGSTYTLDLYGDGLVHFGLDDQFIDPAVGEDEFLVSTSGEIIAEGGMVVLSANMADSVVANAINMDGLVRATSWEMNGGQIVLNGGSGKVQVDGVLDASGLDSGQLGGTIKVLGDKVSLLSEAKINASGNLGGGEVLVGGNYLGLGGEPNARVSYVDETAFIHADAIEEGDGGRVIVWADDTAKVHGEISARGGMRSGDGGFVETSGKRLLDVDGVNVDTSAESGNTGTWLLDPDHWVVGSGNEVGVSYISGVDLGESLETANVSLQATNSIEVNEEISFDSANSLTLDSGTGGTVLNADINAPNGNLILRTSGSTSSGNGSRFDVRGLRLSGSYSGNLNGETDIMQALALAGGLNAFADENDIVILRRQQDGSQVSIPFEYSRVKNGKDLDTNIILRSRDVVVVP